MDWGVRSATFALGYFGASDAEQLSTAARMGCGVGGITLLWAVLTIVPSVLARHDNRARRLVEQKALQLEFAVYDHAVNPGQGWVLLSAGELEAKKAEFISQYNDIGLPRIRKFQSGNCCFAVRGGNKLIISGTPYGYQFPADLRGAVRCSEASGYTESSYKFFRVPSLSHAQTFSGKPSCVTNHNPGVYARYKAVSGPGKGDVLWGLYDFQSDPGGGWKAATLADVIEHKESFVAAYNEEGGLSPVKNFRSGNCCIALASGDKIIITGTPYGY